MSSPAAALPSTRPLADPDERTHASVVIYDGECRLCRRQVENLDRFDLTGKLAYLSLHDPRVAQRYPGLTHEEMMRQMYVIDPSGRRHGGAAALRSLTRTLPLLWPAAPFLHIPGSLRWWQWFYMQVAKRRYRFGRADCSDDACQLHFPKEK